MNRDLYAGVLPRLPATCRRLLRYPVGGTAEAHAPLSSAGQSGTDGRASVNGTARRAT
jgi:hypothetical protein